MKMATQAPLRTAIGALRGILDDCTNEVQLQMQWMGRCETPWHIDAEIGDASDESLTPEPLFTYRRYDIELDRDWLRTQHDVLLSLRDLNRLSQFDNPGNAQELLDLARVVAAKVLPDSQEGREDKAASASATS